MTVGTGSRVRQCIAVSFLGAIFALGVSQALSALETRHLVAVVAALVMFSAALAVANRLSDLLLYLLALNLPFTSIEKTFAIASDVTFVTPGIAVGLADLALIGLYALWFMRVVVQRREARPHLSAVDLAVVAFIGAHLLSVVNSVSPQLSLYETLRLGKYALLFFYLEHNVRRDQIKYLVAGLMLAIVFQSMLGVAQQRTGRLLGIGRTKGSSELQYEQYTVTGFEAVRRAEGTTFDSHALALFFAMSLAVPLAIGLTPTLGRSYRLAGTAVFVAGLPGLVVAFARAGWVAFAGSAVVLLAFFVRWRQWRTAALAVAVALGLGVPAMLPFAKQIKQRLFEAPPELVTARFETIDMSLDIWRRSPLTGCGANAYMRALELQFSIFEGDPYFIPAHNMIVFMLTEIGVIGLTTFVALSILVAARLWHAANAHDPLLRTVAAALLGGFVAFHLEGLFDPIYATNVVYFLLWFQLGLGMAVARLARSAAPASAPAAGYATDVGTSGLAAAPRPRAPSPQPLTK